MPRPDDRLRALRIEPLDPTSSRDAAALVALLDEYARDPTGGGTPLADDAKARLPGLLASRAHYAGLLAWDGDRPVGLVNAFEGVSTFKADYSVDELPTNPWIHQPFESYDAMRPQQLLEKWKI